MGFPSVGNSLMKKCPHALLLSAFGSLNSFTAMVAYVRAFLTSFVIAYLFFTFCPLTTLQLQSWHFKFKQSSSHRSPIVILLATPTQLECCQTACGGPVSGAYIHQLPTSPTDMIGKWCAIYVARRCQMPAAW